jgi:outer membrane murein-binding lipoprotein Lpp
MTLSIEDLLEDHTVCQIFRTNQASNLSSTTLFSYGALSTYLITGKSSLPHVFQTFFAFDSEITNTAWSTLFSHEFYYAYPASYSAYSGMTFYLQLLIKNPVPTLGSETVDVRLRFKISTYTYDSSTITLDIAKTYSFMLEFYYTTSGTKIKVFICEVDPEGLLIYPAVGEIETSSYITGSASNMAPINYKVTSPGIAGFTGTCRIYEPHYAGIGISNLGLGPYFWKFNHILFGAARMMDYTYYTPANSRSYLLPPKYVIDGSAYDRTAILLNEIDSLSADISDLNDDISSLTDDLAAAQTEIDSLTADLATATDLLDDLGVSVDLINDEFDVNGVDFVENIYDWIDQVQATCIEHGLLWTLLEGLRAIITSIVSLTSNIVDLADQPSAHLTHLKNVIADPWGAIKTNLYRLFASIINMIKEGID